MTYWSLVAAAIGVMVLILGLSIKLVLDSLTRRKQEGGRSVVEDYKVSLALQRVELLMASGNVNDDMKKVADIADVSSDEEKYRYENVAKREMDAPLRFRLSVNNRSVGLNSISERNLQKRLRKAGVYHDWQIASWTPQDVRWMSKELNMPEDVIYTKLVKTAIDAIKSESVLYK